MTIKGQSLFLFSIKYKENLYFGTLFKKTGSTCNFSNYTELIKIVKINGKNIEAILKSLKSFCDLSAIDFKQICIVYPLNYFL